MSTVSLHCASGHGCLRRSLAILVLCRLSGAHATWRVGFRSPPPADPLLGRSGRCVPQFRYGPETITVSQDQPPDGEVLDLVYSHQSLLTSTGGDGAPPSSSSAPTLMARMLEALDLQPGMRVLEIGAGTGYNAALIATITGAPVITIDAGATTVRGAAGSIRRLGLDHQVTVRHSDGYLGEPSTATYDRIIVTCGVAGISPCWLDQLASDGVILAPLAHGGVHRSSLLGAMKVC